MTKKSSKKIINSAQVKTFFVIISVLIQLAVLSCAYIFLGENFTWFYSIMLVLSIIVVLYIAIQDNKTEYKLIWTMLIIAFPILGGLLYVMFWRNLFTKKQLKHYSEIEGLYRNAMKEDINISSKLKGIDKNAYRQSMYLRNSSGAGLYQNTKMKYFPLGEDMLEEMQQAKKYIFFEYFIIQDGKMWGSILDVLEEKAKQGVDVRVMYDDFACLFTLEADFNDNLKKKGISCVAFNKFTHILNSNFNSRNHRKICVIDGNVGFTGGVNIADEYINAYEKHGHWKDTAIMLKGDAVYGLTTMFLSMWNSITHTKDDYENFKPSVTYSSNDFVQTFEDTPINDEPIGERLYMSILNQATDYVYITTPYLIISNDMITALQTAAKSGVDVRIILPGIADRGFVHFLGRSYYKTLIDAGVKIYEYTPGFMHAKMFVSDDKTAVIGTINLDYRSLSLHFECAAWLYNSYIVHDIKDDMLETLEQCEEITKEKIRGKKYKALEFAFLGVLRIFAPFM